MTTIHGFCNRLLAGHPVAAGIDPALPRARRAGGARGPRARPSTRRWREFLAERRRRRARRRSPPSTSTGCGRSSPAPTPSCAAAARPSRGCPSRRRADPVEAIAARRSKRPGRRWRSCKAGRPQPRAGRAGAGAARREPRAAADARRAGARCAPTARRSRSLAYREAIDAAIAAAAEAGEGGEAYRHLGELLGLFSARFEAAKERRAGIDFEDLQILAARLLERAEIGEAYRARFSHLLVDEFQDTNRLQLRLIEALRGPAQRADGGRRRAAVDLRLPPRRPRRLPRAAASGSTQRADAELMALSGNFRSRPEVIGAVNALGDDAARRRLPAAAGRRRAAGAEPPPGERPGGRAAADRARRLGRGGDRAGAGDRRPHPAQLPGRGPLPSPQRLRELADERRRRAARWSCCCAPSPTSTPTRTRWSAPGCAPTSSAAAATGPSSRSPTSARCWRRSPTRSTTRRCSAPSPPPPAALAPDTLWLLRAAAGRRRHVWPALERGGRAPARPSWPSRSGWSRSPTTELELLRALRGDARRACASARPRLSLAGLIEAAIDRDRLRPRGADAPGRARRASPTCAS